MYLQGRIEIDATLCECLTDFRNITEQEFGGSFASFVTLLCNSGERDSLLLLYLNLTEEIYKMGHSCLGVLCNAELTVHFWDQGSSSESNSIAPSSRISKPAYVKPKICAMHSYNSPIPVPLNIPTNSHSS